MGSSRHYKVHTEGMKPVEVYELGKKIIKECSDKSEPIEVKIFVKDRELLSSIPNDINFKDRIQFNGKTGNYPELKELIIKNIDRIYSIGLSKELDEKWVYSCQLHIFNDLDFYKEKKFATSIRISFISDLAISDAKKKLTDILMSLNKNNLISTDKDINEIVTDLYNESISSHVGSDFNLRVAESSTHPHGFNFEFRRPSLEKIFRSFEIIKLILFDKIESYFLIMKSNFKSLSEILEKIPFFEYYFYQTVDNVNEKHIIGLMDLFENDKKNSLFIEWNEVKWSGQSHTEYNFVQVKIENGRAELYFDINDHIMEDIVSLIKEKIVKPINHICTY